MNTYIIQIQTDGDLTVATVTRNEQSVTYKLTHWRDQENAVSAFDSCASDLAQIEQSRNDFNSRVMNYYANPISEGNIKRLLGFNEVLQWK